MTDLKSGIALAAQAAGNRTRLAQKLGLRRQAVHQWKHIPAERVLAVEAATGIRREQLRPDLYPSCTAERVSS